MNDFWSDSDRTHMGRAITIAAVHNPHPNPRVGCLVVDQTGAVAAEGAHEADGTDHAEIHALRVAGARAPGATAYVTLEPCAHDGRTPPCATALVRGGIATVFVATLDPDPRVSGRGMQILADAGVTTSVGLLEAEAIELDRGYHHHRRSGRPHVRVVLTGDVPGGLSPAANADLEEIRDHLDYVVGGAGDLLHHPAAHAVSVADQLAALGADGIVDLGIRDDPGLVAELARAGLIDAVTMYCLQPQPTWGPIGSGDAFTITDVRSIGPEHRIDARRTG